MFLVIQGIADVDGKTDKDAIKQAVDFTYNAVQGKKNTPKNPEGPEAGEGKTFDKDGKNFGLTEAGPGNYQELEKVEFSPDEARVLKMVKDTFQDYFTVDAFEGLVAHLKRGSLGLVKNTPKAQIEASLGDHMQAASAGQVKATLGDSFAQEESVAEIVVERPATSVAV